MGMVGTAGEDQESLRKRTLKRPSASGVPLKDILVRLRASTSKACRRLAYELDELVKENPRHVVPLPAPLDPQVLLEWVAWLPGPAKTPYEGGFFRLAFFFPEAYPFEPPRVEFITPCYHPNVSTRGQICLNVLKQEWSPLLTLQSLLMCISALLAEPNPDDPLNEEAAQQLAYDPRGFDAEARKWTMRYANHSVATMAGDPGGMVEQAPPPAGGRDAADDPLATYQTVGGRALDEAEAVRLLEDRSRQERKPGQQPLRRSRTTPV